MDEQLAELTDKQQAFVEAYFQCGFNATEAAARAGYAGDRNTLASVGSENLRKPNIAAKIAAGMAERAMPAEEVLARLAAMARSDVSVFLTPSGDVDLAAEQARANSYLLKKVRVRNGSTKRGDAWTETEIELHDPQAALVQIGRHLALFTDNVDARVRAAVAHEDMSGLGNAERVKRLRELGWTGPLAGDAPRPDNADAPSGVGGA